MRFIKGGGYPHESTCKCTHFKHICSHLLPLVHRPKRRLTGDNMRQQFNGTGHYTRIALAFVNCTKTRFNVALKRSSQLKSTSNDATKFDIIRIFV